jgi:hypothetical protein
MTGLDRQLSAYCGSVTGELIADPVIDALV